MHTVGDHFLPHYVIVMSEEEALLMISHVVNNAHAGYKIDQILVCVIEKIIAALMTSVSIHPLQTKLAFWCSFVRHRADGQKARLLW